MFLVVADELHEALQHGARRRPEAPVALRDLLSEADTRSEMTTFAALQDAERELQARTQAAWTTYGDELRGLDRIAYDLAEGAAWDTLQATLRELAEQRSRAPAASPGD